MDWLLSVLPVLAVLLLIVGMALFVKLLGLLFPGRGGFTGTSPEDTGGVAYRTPVLQTNTTPLGMAVWTAHWAAVKLQDTITLGSPEDIEQAAITAARTADRLARVMREQTPNE